MAHLYMLQEEEEGLAPRKQSSSVLIPRKWYTLPACRLHACSLNREPTNTVLHQMVKFQWQNFRLSLNSDQ